MPEPRKRKGSRKRPPRKLEEVYPDKFSAQGIPGSLERMKQEERPRRPRPRTVEDEMKRWGGKRKPKP